MAEILPAILAKRFTDIGEKVGLVVGNVKAVQVDICDGRFAGDKTWPYGESSNGGSLRYDASFEEILSGKQKLPFAENIKYEFDLMVRDPETLIADCVKAGASGVILHLGSSDRLLQIIEKWKGTLEIGLALRPSASVSEAKDLIGSVKLIQCMGSDKIGYSGVTLDYAVIEKIREIRKGYPEHKIGVDIGVNTETAPALVGAGADRLAVGSALFKSDDIIGTIEKLKSL